MDWLFLLLYRDHGYLLQQHVEREHLNLFKMPVETLTVRTTQSLAFPMLSSSIFSSNGSVYHQSAVFGTTFQLNQTALEEVGLPALTGSFAWSNLTANLAVSGNWLWTHLALTEFL